MIKSPNNKILVQLTPRDYNLFTTEPNITLFRGVVYSSGGGSFGENPIPLMGEDGGTKFSWVRKPNESGVNQGDNIIFIRDGLGIPAVIKDDNPVEGTLSGSSDTSDKELTHLVLIEESHIFGIVE